MTQCDPTGQNNRVFAQRPANAQTFSMTYEPAAGWSDAFPDLDSSQTLVIVFADTSYWHDRGPLIDLQEAFPTSVIVGSGASETAHNGDLLTNHISVGIMRFEHTELRHAVTDLPSADSSERAGSELASQLDHPNLKGVLLFAKGLDVEATEMVVGLQSGLADGIPIAGGLASDRDLRLCWVYANGDLRDDAVCAVGLVGEKVELVCGSGGGWLPASDRHVATKSTGKRIFEIDQRRAYDVLAEQLASSSVDQDPWSVTIARETIALKLGGMDFVRSILASNELEGYIEVAGDVPQGVEIEFMESTIDEILDGVDEAAHAIRMKTVGLTENALCVVFGCMGRISILGARTSEEVQQLQGQLGREIRQVGMYSLGEILTTSSGHPQVHNLTMTAAVIREH